MRVPVLSEQISSICPSYIIRENTYRNKTRLLTQVLRYIQCPALSTSFGFLILHEDVIVDKVDMADLDEVNNNIEAQGNDDLIYDDEG